MDTDFTILYIFSIGTAVLFIYYVDHAVNAVGYGQESLLIYWIDRNSWGRTWGEHGYISILKGMNLCGISTHLTFPIPSN